jgi:hypothetical protein
MRLTFSSLPEIATLRHLKTNPANTALFERQTAEYKERILLEMKKVYDSSAQTQENVDQIIESLITRVAELTITGHILDTMVKDIPDWLDPQEPREDEQSKGPSKRYEDSLSK